MEVAIIYDLPIKVGKTDQVMTQAWQQFLDQSGAERDDNGCVQHFHGSNDVQVCVGDHLAIIRVSGQEAEKFLQGQLTSDITPVAKGHTRLGAHLSVKGRVMASYRLIPSEQGIDLLTPRSRAEQNLAALQKYAMFSKVTLTLDEERVPLLLPGTAGADRLRAYDIPVPSQPGDALHAAHTAVARLENGARYVLLIDKQHAIRMLEQLPLAQLGAANAWRLSDVMAGEAQVEQGGEDLWLPQVLNYDLLSGVSFKKGCYLGQEIVARMHFKGTLKQRLLRRDWPGDTALSAGTALRNAQGKAIGEVVTSAVTPAGIRSLVVLRLDHEGDIWLDDQPLQSRDATLPYSLPAAEPV